MMLRRLLASAVLLTLVLGVLPVQASTVPDTLFYEGRMLDSAGSPLTSAFILRFSLWKSADWVAGDVSAGAVNTGAANYGGWFEVQTVTPNSNGVFHAELGSSTALPTMDFSQHKYLQVEAKAVGEPDTSYTLLDPTSDGGADTNDRKTIGSVPYAKNAESVGNRTIGTASGNLVLLGPGGKVKASQAGSGTTAQNFRINTDNADADAILTFGSSLGAKTLQYSSSRRQFEFNDNVSIAGDLTVSGRINGVSLSAIGSSPLSVTSSGGLSVSITSGNYRIGNAMVTYAGSNTVAVLPSVTNYIFFGSGGLTVRTASFPADESFIPLAAVVTSATNVTGVTDKRVLQTDTRQHDTVKILTPEFEKAIYKGDGSNNVGILSLSQDASTKQSYYLWTSSRSTLQDYDVFVHVLLPADFVGWKSGSLRLTYRSLSASAAENALDLSVYDTSGAVVSVSGTATGLASTSWATTTINFVGSPTWTAGQEFVLKFHLSAKNASEIHLGSLELHSTELIGQ